MPDYYDNILSYPARLMNIILEFAPQNQGKNRGKPWDKDIVRQAVGNYNIEPGAGKPA